MIANEHDYMRAFAEVLSAALDVTVKQCQVPVKDINHQSAAQSEGGTEGDQLLEELRGFYKQRIKALNANYDRHDTLEKALGIYYGALVTQFCAIVGKWQTIKSQKNAILDLEQESRDCVNEVLQRWMQTSLAANRYAANLWLAETELMNACLGLCKLIQSYVTINGITYDSAWRYHVLGVCASQYTTGKVTLCFNYWDNVDLIGANLSQLFTKSEDRSALRDMARRCLKDVGQLADDLSTVHSIRPVELVRLGELPNLQN